MRGSLDGMSKRFRGGARRLRYRSRLSSCHERYFYACDTSVFAQPFRQTSALQLTHKSNQILFLLIAQLQLENDVEIFDCVLKR